MSISSAHPNRTILVVDDSELTRAVITRILQQEGFEVLTAGDGAEGAVLAMREQPQVVVTDLDMPLMDGYQLARLLKSDPSTRHIPLLILTSHGEASSRFWGLETGADAYLVKSGLENELVECVERLLSHAEDPGTGTSDAPQTPLDVLGRVSRHLDSRLLEAVLANRIFERGMEAQTLREAGAAILEMLAEIVDAWMLGLALAEPEKSTVYLRLVEQVARSSTQPVLDHLLDTLEVDLGTPRDLQVEGGHELGGREINPEGLVLLDLPLRGARGVLAVAPKKTRYRESREHELLSQGRRNLALVLDNARLAERLRELSMTDGLTRLLNRRTVHQRLCEEFVRAMRYGHPLSVALCDLDHFKAINDTHGHEAGDKVLISVAEVLDHQARTPDVAGRYGGEEFLVVLPETDLQNAVGAANRLRRTIADQAVPVRGGASLHVTASLGVAALSELDATRTPDGLLRLADERLYQAKAAGRNRVVP